MTTPVALRLPETLEFRSFQIVQTQYPFIFLSSVLQGDLVGRGGGPPILDVGSRGCALLTVVLRPHQVCRHRFQDDVSGV